VKVHHITALGVDLIVLPPDAFLCDICKSPAGTPNEHNWCDGCTVPAVGDVVDGDVECLSCGGAGWWWCDIDSDNYIRQRCGCGSGTVSVPHVVREVLPIVSEDEWMSLPVTDSTPCFIACTTGSVIHDDGLVTTYIDLPDAEPGGVALIVERAS
jgi:hypothetical protein